MARFLIYLTGLMFTAMAAPAHAWWDGGHMQIAYLAYSKLTLQAKAKVDQLIKLNPDYASWVAGVSDDQAAEIAFMHASTWADDIKDPAHGYSSQDDKADAPDAGQNLGYGDKRVHAYWHFTDRAFSTDGTALVPPDPVNALTQIKLLAAAIQPKSDAPDALRSYDLVWLIHLIGDVHQPLHAETRVAAGHPKGDRGGNDVSVRPATGDVVTLHAYWDGLLGGYTTPRGAMKDADASDGLAKVTVDPKLAAIADPEKWLEESFEAAKNIAYAEPILSGTGIIELTRDYETSARNAARTRAALASTRLANLLNQAFGGESAKTTPQEECGANYEPPQADCEWQARDQPSCVHVPVNIGQLKRQLKKYYRCDYRADIARVLGDATAYLETRAAQVEKPALVLDIDETSLSNWNEIWQDDFGYTGSGPCEMKPDTACGWNAWELTAQASAIEPTLSLFNVAKRKGVKVFFITGRRDTRERTLATENNLKKVGYENWDGLIMRDAHADCMNDSVVLYKRCERQKIADQGFRIIANVGDQWSDLDKDPAGEPKDGYVADRNFKVPNPFYFIDR